MKKFKAGKHLGKKSAMLLFAVMLLTGSMVFLDYATYGKGKSEEKASERVSDVAVLTQEIEIVAEPKDLTESEKEDADGSEITEDIKLNVYAETVEEQKNDKEIEIADKANSPEETINKDESDNAEAITGVQVDDGGKGKYYRENSEVISVINASESETTPNEQEVIELLSARGFSGNSITYEYRMGGTYRGKKTIKGEVEKTRPMYQTDYYSAKGELWTIYVINGSVYANPVSYNINSNFKVQLLISETEELTSYDHTTNNYYVTIPKESAVIVKTVKKIDAATLDSISCEDINDL